MVHSQTQTFLLTFCFCLFSTVQDITISTGSLSHDLSQISEWAVQWKMNFNPDLCKQAQVLLLN